MYNLFGICLPEIEIGCRVVSTVPIQRRGSYVIPAESFGRVVGFSNDVKDLLFVDFDHRIVKHHYRDPVFITEIQRVHTDANQVCAWESVGWTPIPPVKG